MRQQVTTIARMAADLVRTGLPQTEREAVRSLMALPYRWQQVARLAGQALAEARQLGVAEQMAQRQ